MYDFIIAVGGEAYGRHWFIRSPYLRSRMAFSISVVTCHFGEITVVSEGSHNPVY